MLAVVTGRAPPPDSSSRIGQSGRVVAVAVVDEMLQRLAQAHQLGDLAVDLGELGLGDRLHVGALARLVAVERQQLAAFLDGEAEAARALQEAQPVNVLVRIVAIAVAAARRLQQSDVLVVADGLRPEGRSVRMRRRCSSLSSLTVSLSAAAAHWRSPTPTTGSSPPRPASATAACRTPDRARRPRPARRARCRRRRRTGSA